MPPTFVLTGALDLFIDEDIEYARRLIQSGVPTELHVYPGAYHAFNLVVDAGITRQFLQDYNNALKRIFNGDFRAPENHKA